MRIGGHRFEVEWGHLTVATLVLAFCVWYLLDARSVSLHPNNLLLVQPATFFAVLLYVLLLPQIVRRVPDDPEEAAAARDREHAGRPGGASTPGELLAIASLAAALGLFAFSLERVGFDVATWLFMVVALFICGERRPLVLLGFATAFTLLVIYGYGMLVPYPIVTTVL